MNTWFCILAPVAIVTWWYGARTNKGVSSMPLNVFLIVYTLTTTIGASSLALMDSRLLWLALDPTLDPTFARTGGFDYWCLLFLPYFVLPACEVLMRHLRFKSIFHAKPVLDPEVHLWSYAITFCIFAAYCLVVLIQNGYGDSLLLAMQSSGDYQSLIILRSEMADKLGTNFYGLLYVGLPTASFVALFKAVKLKSWTWGTAFAISAGAIVILSLAIVQKAPLLIYVLAITCGLVLLKVLRPWMSIAGGVACVALLTFLQSYFAQDWSAARSALHIVFRLATSFPFYVGLYPSHMPYLGVNYGFGLLGWGVTLDDNLRVFDYMYPDVIYVQGASTAAAHVRAYAQGGLLCALVVLVIIGYGTAWVSRRWERELNPYSFAAQLQVLVTLYYLTQTSLRGALLESYGLRYIVPVFVTLYCVQWTLRSAGISVANTIAFRAKDCR
jgi:hypothetical protein